MKTNQVAKQDQARIQRTGFNVLVAAIQATHPALAETAARHQNLIIATAIKAGLQHEDEAFAVLFDRKLWVDRDIVKNTSPQSGFDGFGMGV
jgi:hypothetical protein